MGANYAEIRAYGPYTLFVCIFVAFGGFLFGYDSSNIGGVLSMGNWLSIFGYKHPDGVGCALSGDYQGQTYCLSSTNRSLITSLLSIGTFFGALSGAPIADRLGRRGGIMTASAVFAVGAAVQTGVETVPGLIVGRVIAGWGVGLVSMMVPMYQSEAAPPAIRGAIVSFYQLSITIGILVSQLVDLGTEKIQSTASWRVPIGLQMVFAGMLLVGCLFIPESPRFLFKQGENEKGRQALARMRGQSVDSERVQTEMGEIMANLEFEKSLGLATYADCFKSGHNGMLGRTMCGILVQMFQQLTGVNFIFYYGTQFFKQSGVSSPYLITVATGIVNVGMTIPGIYLVEKLGRRKFLIYGAVWMSVCNLIIGVVAVTKAGTTSANQVLVGFNLMFVGAFAATWGPGAWVLISELYPLKLRGKAMSLATASNWFWNWVLAFCVPYITDAQYGNLGSKIAFIWFGTSLCGAVWTYFYVPETKSHSLEQLDKMFEAGLKPWQTAAWVPEDSAVLSPASTSIKHDHGDVEKSA